VTDLLAHRAFLRFWCARLGGTAGNQMLMLAVGWHLYELTHSAWDLGLVGLLQFLPALALVLVAGQVIDRLHRARIVAVCLQVQLRSSSGRGFPEQQTFLKLKEAGQLVSSHDAAARLVAYLGRADFGANPVADVRDP